MSSTLRKAEVVGIYGQLLDLRRLDGKLSQGFNYDRDILVKLT